MDTRNSDPLHALAPAFGTPGERSTPGGGRSRPARPDVAELQGPQRGAPAAFLPEVDSLRGIAILLVWLHHADALLANRDATMGIETSLAGAFVTGGQTGVSLFFVLSAFCLSLPLLRERHRGATASWIRFYQRRALRILPAYWTAVLAAGLLTGAIWSAPGSVVLHATFLGWLPTRIVGMHPLSDVWWSLATEVQFYVLLPLLPCAWSTTSRKMLLAMLVAVHAVAFVGVQMHWLTLRSIPSMLQLGLSVFGRGPIFVAGIAVAWMWDAHGRRWRERLAGNRLLRLGGADIALAGVLATLGALLSWQVRIGYWRAEEPGHFTWHILEGLLWSMVLGMLLVMPLRSRRLFTNPLLARLGLLSYSIYLIHLPVLVYAMRYLRSGPASGFESWTTGSLPAMASIAALTIAMSELTYRFIESPFLARKATLASPSTPRS